MPVYYMEVLLPEDLFSRRQRSNILNGLRVASLGAFTENST